MDEDQPTQDLHLKSPCACMFWTMWYFVHTSQRCPQAQPFANSFPNGVPHPFANGVPAFHRPHSGKKHPYLSGKNGRGRNSSQAYANKAYADWMQNLGLKEAPAVAGDDGLGVRPKGGASTWSSISGSFSVILVLGWIVW